MPRIVQAPPDARVGRIQRRLRNRVIVLVVSQCYKPQSSRLFKHTHLAAKNSTTWQYCPSQWHVFLMAILGGWRLDQNPFRRFKLIAATQALFKLLNNEKRGWLKEEMWGLGT
jgi:hypothetical protein